MESFKDEYDFIIVGGGTSGSVLASRLSRTPSAPKVLLLEGGGLNDDPTLRSTDKRWNAFLTEPLMNWGYMSVPQNQLVGQQIPCARGRGLGGSSAINFSNWLVGHREDFNLWADKVDDPSWKWDGDNGVKQRLRKIENLRPEVEPEYEHIIDTEAQKLHSANGVVDVGFKQHWSENEVAWFNAAKEFGMDINGDINSGDPTGFGLSPCTYSRGLRVTAATAYLSSPPPNLTIKTDTPVAKVVIDDSKKAVGVHTLAGEIYKASKEVILSAGSFDTPKILLLSGIGTATDLSSHSITLVQDLPGVGKGLKDHCLATITLLLKANAVSAVPTAAEFPAVAKTNPVVARDPLRETGTASPMAWLSSDAVKGSTEFAALDKETKEYLLKVPSYEMMTVDMPMSPEVFPLLGPGDRVVTLAAAVQNNQSTGSVRLASSDPKEHALVDPNLLAHPYDQRVAIEALRRVIALSKVPTFADITEKVIEGPEGDSDEALLDHFKKGVVPIFHFLGTCKMGKHEDKMAVVDKNFRVNGLAGLRVVDLSVAPVLPNNHTQSTAYLIGETAAEKMVEEYGL